MALGRQDELRAIEVSQGFPQLVVGMEREARRHERQGLARPEVRMQQVHDSVSTSILNELHLEVWASS
jgi:hypothetical protein